MKENTRTIVVGSVVALAAAIALAAAATGAKTQTSTKNAASTLSTNDNGTVSRVFTESTVSTNGNMVTEHRRETRTTMDAEGNMLATTTSEYAQSYPVGDTGMASLTAGDGAKDAAKDDAKAGETAADAFLGLKFGSVFDGTNLVADADEPTLLRAKFKPKKALAGFDDYYVYVTPKTHKVVKVFACAKEAVEPTSCWSRHYLIEALEKKYHTWARPRSWCRPIYAFDIGGDRYVTVVLEGATRDYETVVAAWDDAMLTAAADETEQLRAAARKSAAERRSRRVDDAADAF